ncbi:MAG: response regulator transcription factor [Chloroflexi bacterium]|nr:response regulator transcription factor [Chloroflexota bacterium]
MPFGNKWARIAWWGLLFLSLGIIVLGTPAASYKAIFLASAPEELTLLNLSPIVIEALSFTALFLRVLLIAGFLAAAALIFWRRGDNRPALFFSAALIVIGVTNGVINYLPEPLPPSLRVYEMMADFLSLLFMFSFPDGRVVPKWIGWLLAPWLIYLGIVQLDLLPGDATEDILDLVFLGSGLLALIYRYRTTSAEQQQQIKWVVFGTAVIILIAYGLNLIHFAALNYFAPASSVIFIYEVFRTFVQIVVLLILPTVITISILRYHLWDIDFYINRGIVYSFLTLLLGLVFFGSALLLQNLSIALFGNQFTSVMLTASAVIIAILFQPARQQLQHFVDRRFFGIQPYLGITQTTTKTPAPLADPLSEREKDVLGFIDAGLSNREIADQLYLTVGTVKWHTNNIYTKLGVNSRTQALVRAREFRLLSKNQTPL